MRLPTGARLRRLLILGWLALAPSIAMAAEVSLSFRGLALSGALVLAEGKDPADGIVLITHGTLAHHRMEIVATLQALLAERGLSSLGITLSLGIDARRGMYDCALAHRHRQSGAADEIAAWVRWLGAHGARRIALMGHSRGGNQTARFAAEADHPAVVAVVLLAPATRNAEVAARRYAAAGGGELASVLERARRAEPDDMLKGVRFLFCRDTSVAAGSFLDYYADDRRHDTPSLLPEIAKPTLVIAGSADRVVPDLPQRVAPFLDHDTRLVVVEDAGHFFRDLFAEDVADAVAEFLEPYLAR